MVPKQLDTLLHPRFVAAALKAAEVVGKGLAASPGSACGQIVFTAEEAEEMVKSGSPRSADRGCQGRLPQLGQPPRKCLS